MKAYKTKKVIELVKEYQWDSAKNEEEAKSIAFKIVRLFTKRTPVLPFKKIPCEFSNEGLRVFKKQKKGFIVGESKNKNNYMVIWDNTKYRHSYHKSFIKYS